MTDTQPALLQLWGVVAIVLTFSVAFVAAYYWHRARSARPALHLDVAAVGLLALLTGGFFWRALTESGIWMPAGGGDFASFYFPNYTYVAAQISSGTIPLWNPHLFSGMPLAADIQSAIFYPLNWILFGITGVDYGALEWLLIAHYWLAATFFYIFMRDAGVSRLGALAGAVAFAFSGFMVAHFGHLPMVPVATWIPLVLLSLRRSYASRGREAWAWAIAAGIFMALSLLAGHAQIFAYGLIASGLLWLVLLVTGEPVTLRSGLSWAGRGLLAPAIAIAIGAIQLLPSLELATQSVRASVSYEEAMAFPGQPIAMLNLLLPRVFGGDPTSYNFGIYQSTENWGYMGVVTLALAAAGLLFRRGRLPVFFALLAVAGLVIMVGDLSISSGWMFKFFPGFNKLRDAGRALLLVSIGVAGLAGFGLDVVARSLSRTGSARRNILWWLVGISGVLVIALFGVMPVFYAPVLLGGAAEYGRLPGAINDLGMLVIWLGLFAAVGWAAYRRRLSPIWAVSAMLLIMVLDIFSPNSRFNPTLKDVAAGFKHTKATAFLRQATVDEATGIPLRVNSDTDVQDRWQPSNAALHDLYDTGGAWNPLKLERYDYLWEVARRYPDTPLYDLTGAAFEVISPTVGAHAGQPKWQLAYEEPELQIYRNKNAMPRAFIVHQAAVEPNPESAVLSLRRFDVEPRHTVILESGAPVASSEAGSAETGAPPGESARATRYDPNAVDIEVSARSPGWLVLTDAWYPGWEAHVDGRAAEIVPADYAYRAIKIEAGKHTITMRFRPSSWVTGRAVTVVSVVAVGAALLLLLFWPRLRERSRRVSSLR